MAFAADPYLPSALCNGSVWWLSSPSAVPVPSECVQLTLLVWAPAAFFWALFPALLAQFWRIRKHRRQFLPAASSELPFSPLLLSKMALCTLLAALSLLQALKRLDPSDEYARAFPAATLSAPLIRVVTMCGLFASLRLCQRHGVVSSGIVHLSWLLHLVCALPELYAWHQKLFSPSTAELSSADAFSPVRLCLSLCWCLCLLVQCLLHLFADPTVRSPASPPHSPRPSPEPHSSFVSRLTYSWFGPLPRIGRKRDLVADDLWELNAGGRADSVVPQWEHSWVPAVEAFYRRRRQAAAEGLGRALLRANQAKHQNGLTDVFQTDKEEEGDQSRPSPRLRGTAPAARSPPTPSLVWSLLKMFKWELLVSGAVKLAADVLQFANPLLLRQLISIVSERNSHVWEGVACALAMFVASELRSLCTNYYFFIMFRMGTRIQTALTVAIYKKTLRLSNASRRDRTLGEIVNLMAIDVERFQMITPHIQQFWSSPLQISIALVLLFDTLGISALPGVIVMAVIIPLSFISSIFTRKWQVRQMQLRDERSKLCNEILNGIKVIKLYAWERPMMEAVERIRSKELHSLLKAGLVRSVIDTFNFTSPFLVAIVAFLTFSLLEPSGRALTPQIAFVSLTLFNQIRSPMTMIGLLINMFVQTMVSNQRIREFLVAEELDPGAIGSTVDAKNSPLIRMKNADFCWEAILDGRQAEKNTANKMKRSSTSLSQKSAVSAINNSAPPPLSALRDISIEVRRGDLVAVVGKVGAGKSSLLSAILGEMERLRGEVAVAESRGAIAYVPQTAWIQNMSLRDNITFGSPFDARLYELVVNVCALRYDLDMLPQGDATEIGEKGINLSGGQRARVSLARAVYQQSELYLLDDPLSAVDSHVGRWIFDKAIGPGGILSGRTRILVTHGLHYLSQCDQILLVDEGRIVERGTYAELCGLPNGKFAQLVAEGKMDDEENKAKNIEEEEEEEEREDDDEEQLLQAGSSEDLTVLEQIDRQVSMLQRRCQSDVTSRSPPIRQRRLHRTATSSSSAADDHLNRCSVASLAVEKESEQGDTTPKTLIEKERVETGRVKVAVYLDYMRAAGWLCSMLFFGLYCANQCMQVARNFWLSAWADGNQQNGTTPSDGEEGKIGTGERLAVYAAIGIFEALSFWFALLALLLGGLSASRNLHSPMMSSIMHAPMSFFDTTPIGRLLNRFGRDIEVADTILPINTRYFVQCITMVLATLITICISTWVFSLVIPPLFVLYFIILRMYVPTSRQLKRLESNNRSPIYTHFGESIQGASSIRAFHRQQPFCAQMESRVDSLVRIKYLSLIANRWLAVRLELIGNCVVLFAALFGALSHEWNFISSAGLVGLSVSYALNITEVMNFAIRQISELETNIVSIERLKEYAERVESEEPWEISGQRPPVGWPRNGEIRFENYSTRYRPGLDLVVRQIVATIRPAEKVGIVGRTGAGKSSLTLALFRMIEAVEGRILIDGIDIKTMGLHDLRANITIIPQDPVLFSGTLRFNLDPFNRHSDSQIWDALEHSHLRKFVSELHGTLDHEISEGGENISLGQRQLLCLARALLRSSRILVLDEATASVDLSTDALIQETIRREFKHCTVFTIAHRLATIYDYDRVVVLEQGQIREFDSPQNLLANRNSLFAAMAADAKKNETN